MYYCIVNTSGELEATNLQLYSLQKAAECWNALLDEAKGIERARIIEQGAFVLTCLGLSMSQLLGQNCPSPDSEDVAEPGVLLSSVLERACNDRTTRRRLQSKFKDFLNYYGAVRHLGQTKGDVKHRTIDQLTLEKLESFCDMAVEVWDLVVRMHEKTRENDIIIYDSIRTAVGFRDKEGAD